MCKLNINFDDIFPLGISAGELKKLQSDNKLDSFDLTNLNGTMIFKPNKCDLTGPIDVSCFENLSPDDINYFEKWLKNYRYEI